VAGEYVLSSYFRKHERAQLAALASFVPTPVVINEHGDIMHAPAPKQPTHGQNGVGGASSSAPLHHLPPETTTAFGGTIVHAFRLLSAAAHEHMAAVQAKLQSTMFTSSGADNAVLLIRRAGSAARILCYLLRDSLVAKRVLLSLPLDNPPANAAPDWQPLRFMLVVLQALHASSHLYYAMAPAVMEPLPGLPAESSRPSAPPMPLHTSATVCIMRLLSEWLHQSADCMWQVLSAPDYVNFLLFLQAPLSYLTSDVWQKNVQAQFGRGPPVPTAPVFSPSPFDVHVQALSCYCIAVAVDHTALVSDQARDLASADAARSAQHAFLLDVVSAKVCCSLCPAMRDPCNTSPDLWW